MSVPEAKALSPAPWNTSTLTERSLFGLLANLAEPLVHFERKGVAGLGAVESDLADAVLEIVEQVVGGRSLLVHASPVFGNFVVEKPP